MEGGDVGELSEIRRKVDKVEKDVSFIRGAFNSLATKAYVLQMIAEHATQTSKKDPNNQGVSMKFFVSTIGVFVAAMLALSGAIAYLVKTGQPLP